VERSLQLPQRKGLHATKPLQTRLGTFLDEHQQRFHNLRGWDSVDSKCSANSNDDNLSCVLQHYDLMDARRAHDGARVSLKRINVSRHPFEIEIARYFSTSPLDQEPANHCVPIYDVLKVPGDDNLMILVMPLLRDVTEPFFDTVGEVVDCVHQLLEVRSLSPDSSYLIYFFF